MWYCASLSFSCGSIHLEKRPGAILHPGMRVATLDLDDPASVMQAVPYTGTFSKLTTRSKGSKDKLNHVSIHSCMLISRGSRSQGVCGWGRKFGFRVSPVHWIKKIQRFLANYSNPPFCVVKRISSKQKNESFCLKTLNNFWTNACN